MSLNHSWFSIYPAVGFVFAFTPTTHLKEAYSGWNLTGPDSTGCRFPQISWWAHGLSREGGGNSLPPEEVEREWAPIISCTDCSWPAVLAKSEIWAFLLSDISGTLTPGSSGKDSSIHEGGMKERVPCFSWNFILRILSLHCSTFF